MTVTPTYTTDRTVPNAGAGGIHCHFGHDGGPFGKRVDLVLAERLPRLSSVATMCQDVALWDWQLTWALCDAR